MSKPDNSVDNVDKSENPTKNRTSLPKKPRVLDIHVREDGTLGFTPRAEKIDSKRGSKFILVRF